MDVDVEQLWSVNQYSCRKGCKREFPSSWALKKHEDSFDCPIVDFENPSSPQLYSPVMMDSFYVQPTEVLNCNDGLFKDFDLEEVVDTNYIQLSNMQQTNCGNPQSIRVKEMMTSPNVSGYEPHEQRKVIDTKKALIGTRNNMLPPDLSQMFSKHTPEILEREEKTSEGKEINTEITFAELNSENSVGSTDLLFSLEHQMSSTIVDALYQDLGLPDVFFDFGTENPFQVPAVSGSQDYVNSQFDHSNYTFIPTRNGCDQSTDETLNKSTNLVHFLDKGNDAHPAVATMPSMMPIEPQMSARPAVATVAPLVLVEPQPQSPPKRGRGRPRKEKPPPVLETQQLEYREWNMHASYPILSDRKSKVASREKIRSSIFGGSDSGASDQEYSPVIESPRKKARRAQVKEDPDYEDVTQSSDASSSTSPEGHDGKDVERRKKNNLSSGKSRQKRKEINKRMENEKELLEERFKKLRATSATLEEAVGILRSLLLRFLAEKKSAA